MRLYPLSWGYNSEYIIGVLTMDSKLKVSAYFLMRSKIAAELPELDTTLFKVTDGLSDSAFINLFLDLLKSIDKENYNKIKTTINAYKVKYEVKTLQELLEEEPVLIDEFFEKAMDLINANAPKGYTFGIKGENRYGFWED